MTTRRWPLLTPLLLLAGCHATHMLGTADASANGGAGGSGGQRSEHCGNGIDDDGNGKIDEGCPCAAGATQRCYRGGVETRKVGACHDGMQACVVSAGATTGAWGDCSGDQGPTTEQCGADGNGDTTDQDCNGAADNGCGCCGGTVCAQPRECPGGPLIGECKHGIQTCGSDGKWSTCEGQVPPKPEICGNDRDDDCNGATDDGCVPPQKDGPTGEPPSPEPPPDAAPDLPPDLSPDLPPDEPPELPPMMDAPIACQDLPPPRLIFPLSTATVTSWRPNLRWELAAGTDGAHVELCSDRACSPGHVLQTYDVTGTTGAPPNDLPIGVAFWHLQAMQGSDRGCAWSTTWEFFVGSRSVAVNTAWGSFPDPNGDGYADALVGEGSPLQTVRVFPGSPGGISTTASSTISLPAGGAYTTNFMNAGDVNGDGFSDVVVDFSSFGENLYLYLGGPAGLATTSSQMLAVPRHWLMGSNQRVSEVTGDVDGDGYSDVVFCADDSDFALQPTLLVFRGGSGGLTGPVTATMGGWFLAGVEDVNGDTFADIVTGEPNMGGTVFLGSSLGSVLSSYNIPCAGRCEYLATADDVNGDGFADVIVDKSAADVPEIRVFLGSTMGIDVSTYGVVTPLGGDHFDGVGDVTGDGYADLASGDSMASFSWNIYNGGPFGLSSMPSSSAPSQSLSIIVRTGDFDGDHAWDALLVDGTSTVYACRGGPTGISNCVLLQGNVLSGGGNS